MQNQIDVENLGGIQSPVDYRDGYAAAAVAESLAKIALPATFHTQLGPVLMQSKIPACVSHSIVDKLKLWWFLKTGEWVDFSPRFLDTLMKRFDGLDRSTDGAYPRLAMKMLYTYGCATTKTVPNDTSLPILQYRNDAILTPEAFAEALQYRIPGYFQVPKDLQSTRASIYLYGAISTLMSIGSEWWTPSWATNDINPLRIPNPIISGHQITPCGWVDETKNTLRNEWSPAWARGGEADYDGIAWQPYIAEQWCIAEIPKDVQSFITTLPNPATFHYYWGTDMKIGDTSEAVKFVQVAFMMLGLMDPVPADELGIFGPKTAAANAKYQQAHRITPVPTHIGTQTRAVLNKQFTVF